MVIIEDTRNKVDKHDLKAEKFKEMGVTIVRSKLAYGDYSLVPSISIDTKKDIYELAQDIDQEHVRFRNELINARDAGCKLIILTENEVHIQNLDDLSEWKEEMWHWEMRKNASKNPKTKRISGLRLARACYTMSQRYGASFYFCSPEESAEVIVRLLEKGGEADDIQR